MIGECNPATTEFLPKNISSTTFCEVHEITRVKFLKSLACLLVAAAFTFGAVAVSEPAYAQGKPGFAGKKEEKGSRKASAREHADSMGKKTRKNKDKAEAEEEDGKKEKKAKRPKRSKKEKRAKRAKKDKRASPSPLPTFTAARPARMVRDIHHLPGGPFVCPNKSSISAIPCVPGAGASPRP